MTTWNDTKTISLNNTTLYDVLQKHQALSESVMYELDETDMNMTLTDADKRFINLVLEKHKLKPLFTVNENQVTTDICNAIYNDVQKTIDDEDLDYGNAEIIFLKKDRSILEYDKWTNATTLEITIEAPHNSIISIDIDLPKPTASDKCLEKYIENFGKIWYKQLLKAAKDFNANETFRELWTNNSPTEPLTFAKWLEKDQEFFHNFASYY
jgi:hypothetical protein